LTQKKEEMEKDSSFVSINEMTKKMQQISIENTQLKVQLESNRLIQKKMRELLKTHQNFSKIPPQILSSLFGIPEEDKEEENTSKDSNSEVFLFLFLFLYFFLIFY
jgi:hypothetical protein